MEEIVSNGNNSRNQLIIQSSKHWSSYFLPLIGVLVGIWFAIESWIVASIILIFPVTKILSNIRTKWILTESYLIFKTGFLPWKRTYLEIPHNLFFEAYYERNFFSVLLGFGNLVLKKTDGTTSFLRTIMMNNKDSIIQNINSIAWEAKENTQQIVHQQVNTSSVSDELLKLSNLKNQGIINDEEFEIQKRKILSS